MPDQGNSCSVWPSAEVPAVHLLDCRHSRTGAHAVAVALVTHNLCAGACGICAAAFLAACCDGGTALWLAEPVGNAVMQAVQLLQAPH